MYKQIFLFIISLTCITSESIQSGFKSPCKLATFVQLGSTKYFFQKKLHQDWSQAKETCEEYGLKLATVKSYEENNKLALLLAREFERLNFSRSNTTIWLGAKDVHHNGVVQWSSGQYLSYNNFLDTPSEYDSSEFLCLAINFGCNSTNYLEWTRQSCKNKFNFICETNNLECYEDYKPKDSTLRKVFGTKYYIRWNPLPWTSALEFCEGQDLRLVSILSEHEHEKLQNILNRDSQRLPKILFWSSGSHHLLDWNNKLPIWMSSGVVKSTFQAYSSREPADQTFVSKFSSSGRADQCHDHYRKEFCVAISLDKNIVSWSSENCMKPLPVICMQPSSCHSDKVYHDASVTGRDKLLLQIDDRGYWFTLHRTKYFVGKTLHYWRGALGFCNSIGMNLLTLETDMERKLISEFLWKNKEPGECSFWLAGTNFGASDDDKLSSSFVWISGALRGKSVNLTSENFKKTSTISVHAEPKCLYLRICTVSAVDRVGNDKFNYFMQDQCYDQFVKRKHRFVCKEKSC